jgi:uncharacterized membrane protein YgcG
MSNLEGVEPSRLAYSYFGKKMLKIAISPQKKTNDGSISFDYDNNICVFLTHTKAYILSEMIKQWKKDGCEGSIGINTGTAGLITVSDGSEYGVDAPCVTIRNIDETGAPVSAFAYTTRTNYHYGIKDYNPDEKSFEKVYFDLLEIDQLLIVLDEYVKAATSAIAASVMEEAKYDLSRLNTKADLVCEKLGIEIKGKKGNGANYSQNSFFNGGGSSSSTGSSKSTKSGGIDDLDDGLGE